MEKKSKTEERKEKSKKWQAGNLTWRQIALKIQLNARNMTDVLGITGKKERKKTEDDLQVFRDREL